MAHPCINCGTECYCNGDIDDVIVSRTPSNCSSCGCADFEDVDEEFFDDEPEFHECPRCDGHQACEDFGCAIELGCGHMIKKELDSDDL